MTKSNMDIVATFDGLTIIHQKIPAREVGRHVHDEHEFFLPLQGEISVSYDEATVKAGPGRMLYVPPKLDHSFTSTAQGSGERIIWLLEPNLWKKHTKAKFNPISMPGNNLAKELLFFLLIHQKVEGARYFISALVEALVESLNGAELAQTQIYSDHIEGKITDDRVRKSVRLIDKDLGTIALAHVAEESGLSLRNFNRLFLQQVGLTPKDYLIRRRIEKAKDLLRNTKMTVTDISMDVGYNSLSKFIEMFKKIEGQLPSDYRSLV